MAARSHKPEPVLLTKRQAAQRCGVSVPVFDQVCDVRPIALAPGRDRLLRYHTDDLDKWIETLKDPSASSGNTEKVLERLGGDRGARERH